LNSYHAIGDIFVQLLGMILSFGMVLSIVIVITKARQRRLEIQADLQSKLIEKFGSTAELIEFLQSPVGRQFVNGVQTGNTIMVRDRVLSGYRRAIVLSFFGGAFIVLWMITGFIGLAWPGVLILALGLGYLVATMTTARLVAASETSTTVPDTQRPM
jgi:hypothetical protein